MKLLLDTCTFLWLSQQPSMLSDRAATAINDPASELCVSDVSILEITLKHSAGKLPLPAVPRRWIPEKLKYHQLKELPLQHNSIYRSGELPRIHSDPFDRLLAAQSLEEQITILSPDVSLSSLGASRVW